MAMHHSSAMVQRLLMRIECLESEVCGVIRFRGRPFTDKSLEWIQLANAKTVFTFLSDKVYDHTTGEEEKEPRLWQALGEQDFCANKFDNLLHRQEEKREELKTHVTQQAAELGHLSTEV